MEKLREVWSGLSGVGKIIALGLVVLVVAAVAASSGSGGSDNTSSGDGATQATAGQTQGSSSSESSDAFKLAVIDTANPSPSDTTVARYSSALARVEGRCLAQPGTGHADYAVKSTQLLADGGVSASSLEILGGVAEALSEPGTESLSLECSEVYALLVTLMMGG